jgi:hypothetical protein
MTQTEVKPVLITNPDGTSEMMYLKVEEEKSFHALVSKMVPYVVVISSVLGIVITIIQIKKMNRK